MSTSFGKRGPGTVAGATALTLWLASAGLVRAQDSGPAAAHEAARGGENAVAFDLPVTEKPSCRNNQPSWSGDISEFKLEDLLGGNITASVSRAQERIDEAPAAVTVITRAQLRVWGYHSVAELLERIVGFYVLDDHMVPNVAVRGLSGGLRAESAVVKLMIDGRPVAFRPTGGNWLGPELIPFSAVERIEIIRGPTSTVYGADAFLGVINVITRGGSAVCGADLWTTGTYSGGAGGGLDSTLGGRFGNFSAVAALRLDQLDRSGLTLPSSSPRPKLRLGVSRDQPAEDLKLGSTAIFTRGTYHFGTGSEISLTGHLSKIDRNGDFADWAQLSTGSDSAGRQRGSHISVWRGHLNLSGDFRLAPRVSLAANLGLFGGSPGKDERIDINSDLTYARRLMDFRMGLVDVSSQWTPVDKLRIVGGLDYLFDRQTLPGVDRALYSGAGGFAPEQALDAISVRRGAKNFLNLGTFLLATWTPTGEEPQRPVLRIDGGLRYDHNNIYQSRVNGRVGAALRLVEALTFKLNYSTAFRAPNTQLLYGEPLVVGDIVGNELLHPQQIHSWEGNVSTRPWAWLQVQTGLSYSYVVDKAEFVFVGVNSVARNLAQVGVVAWETEARAQLENQLWAYANFALVGGRRNREEDGYRARLLGSALEMYPETVLNAGLAYRFQIAPVRLTTEARRLSERQASDANVVENGSAYSIPAAFYLDASIAVLDLPLFARRSTTFSFLVRNLLDNRAAHPGFAGVDYPSAPRTFMLQWQLEL